MTLGTPHIPGSNLWSGKKKHVGNLALLLKEMMRLHCTVVPSTQFPLDNTRILLEHIVRRVRRCERNPLQRLLSCDDQRGKYFLELILCNKLEMYNAENTHTFVSSTSHSAFGNITVNGLVGNWRGSEQPPMSKHRVKRFDIELAWWANHLKYVTCKSWETVPFRFVFSSNFTSIYFHD